MCIRDRTTPETGLSGYYLTPMVGAYYVTADGNFISNELISRDEDALDVDPRDEADQYLKPWENVDLERLCLENNKEEIKQEVGESPLFQVSRKDKIDVN